MCHSGKSRNTAIMVVTRSQTRAAQARADLVAAVNVLDETPLSRTIGFQEYATAYKWVMVGTGRLPVGVAGPLIDHIRIKWAELPEHERKAWEDKAALFRFLAMDGDDPVPHLDKGINQ